MTFTQNSDLTSATPPKIIETDKRENTLIDIEKPKKTPGGIVLNWINKLILISKSKRIFYLLLLFHN